MPESPGKGGRKRLLVYKTWWEAEAVAPGGQAHIGPQTPRMQLAFTAMCSCRNRKGDPWIPSAPAFLDNWMHPAQTWHRARGSCGTFHISLYLKHPEAQRNNCRANLKTCQEHRQRGEWQNQPKSRFPASLCRYSLPSAG